MIEWQQLAYAIGVATLTWCYIFYLNWKFNIRSRYPEQQRDIIRNVIMNQLIQTITFVVLDALTSSSENASYDKSWGRESLKVVCAMVLIDAYQYVFHVLAHKNKTLFLKIHSIHHKFVEPEPIGGFYNHILESLVMDGGSFAFAQVITQMSPEAGALLGLFANLKTTHDHLGLYALKHDFKNDWMSLWSWVSDNDAEYHRLHHRRQNGNFEQPFFTMFDDLVGTRIDSSHT